MTATTMVTKYSRHREVQYGPSERNSRSGEERSGDGFRGRAAERLGEFGVAISKIFMGFEAQKLMRYCTRKKTPSKTIEYK